MACNQKYRNQICSIVGAFLLLLVFLMPKFAEALHEHSCYSSESKRKTTNNLVEERYDISQSKCHICESIKHQSDTGSVSQLQSLCLSPLLIENAGFPNLWKINLGFILSSSNKGPPSSNC